MARLKSISKSMHYLRSTIRLPLAAILTAMNR
ncbi:Uncharacterised protein [Vibrio cholerae]|nr:Uncharacterised protein [Vibrio cholerae]CSI36884.1 Uncharacterised protein [Vibrio cholerae]